MSRAFPRPLPRTLTPLLGESLPGYVLRLSYRLDITPAQLCGWAGLGRRPHSGWLSQPPTGAMVRMTQRQVATFSLACNLSREEVRALTMAGMARRYPPVCLAPVAMGHQKRTPRGIAAGDPWVTTRLTRYCPECLAGDGSPVQDRYGGAWQSRWRLAVVFACTRHQRLLEWACSDCGVPMQAMDPLYQTTLVPQPNGPPLHPIACRQGWWRTRAYCGAWLDASRTPPGVEERVTPHLLSLQARLDQILDGAELRPRSLGRPVSAATYFSDLRVVARLVQAAFPRSTFGSAYRRDIGPYALWYLNDLGDTSASQRDYLATLVRGHYAESDVPPFRSDALGCLMLLAAEFLDTSSPESVSSRISTTLERSGFARHHVRTLMKTPRLSEGLRYVLLTKMDEVPIATGRSDEIHLRDSAAVRVQRSEESFSLPQFHR